MTDQHSLIAPAARARRLALLASGLAAIAVLGGCSSHAPRPEKMAEAARDAMRKGDTPRAVTLTEAAVMADGRNASLRLLLANAYLRSGRFESARTAFSDAIGLGDDSSRAALGLTLADLALGHNSAALDTLNTYSDVIPAADQGLALVMAGQNARGIEMLTNGIRNGQNTPKMRQNLAYAFALSGMWSDARIMAGQDVPADQVDARLQSWAALTRPEDGRHRIASLLSAPMRADGGQPEALALAHFPAPAGSPAPVQAAKQTVAPPVPAPAAELPAADGSAVLARVDLSAVPARPAPVAPPAPAASPAPVRTVAHPARHVAQARPVAAPAHGAGSHLVQLGAYASEESAKRAWQHFGAHNPNLAGHGNQISSVTVNGHQFWRVQAVGFAGPAAARSVCGTLRAHGSACMVMAMSDAARVKDVQSAQARPGNTVARVESKPAAKPAGPQVASARRR